MREDALLMNTLAAFSIFDSYLLNHLTPAMKRGIIKRCWEVVVKPSNFFTITQEARGLSLRYTSVEFPSYLGVNIPFGFL